MIAAWMLYSMVVGGCVAIAAIAAEPWLRARGGPRRLAWAPGVLLATIVPIAMALRPRDTRLAELPREVASGGSDVVVPPLGGWGRGIDLDLMLVAGWMVVSAVLVLLLAVGAWRLRLAMRRARALCVDGEAIGVTDDMGPGVAWFGSPRILVPADLLALDASKRALLIRHEREHLRARDPALLMGSAMALVLMPWNVALWYLVRRLRSAIEIDCDGRVLSHGGDPRTYGELLLAVARWRRPPALATLLPFAEARTPLERRLCAMTEPRRSMRRSRQLVSAAVIVAATLVACETRRPEPVAPIASFSWQDGKGVAIKAVEVTTGTTSDSAAPDRARTLPDKIPASALAGDPNETLLVAYNASGELVLSRRLPRSSGAAPSGITDLPFTPDEIATVDVVKASLLLAPEARGGLITIRLKTNAPALKEKTP